MTCAPFRAATRFTPSAANEPEPKPIDTISARMVNESQRRLPRKAVPTGPRLDLEAAQILKASLDAGERIRRVIALDEVVPDPRLLPVGENRAPREDSSADVSHPIIGGTRRVLDVDQRESARPAREVREGILPALGDPVEVHLERHRGRVATLEEDVIRDPPFDLRELEVVVVVREPDAGRLCTLAELIQEVGDGPVAIEGPPILLG